MKLDVRGISGVVTFISSFSWISQVIDSTASRSGSLVYTVRITQDDARCTVHLPNSSTHSCRPCRLLTMKCGKANRLSNISSIMESKLKHSDFPHQKSNGFAATVVDAQVCPVHTSQGCMPSVCVVSCLFAWFDFATAAVTAAAATTPTAVVAASVLLLSAINIVLIVCLSCLYRRRRRRRRLRGGGMCFCF